jgi:hypothetical protein
MRKIVFLLSFLIFSGGVASAINPDVGHRRANTRVSKYIDGVYAQLKYKRGMKRMKIETFRRAYYGYLNLVEHGKVRNRRYLTVCDFSLSSNTNRLWLIDTRTKQVVINTLVAHGSRTGEEFARYFSNISESHQSSLGFYVTRNTYSGKNGYSMRMDGVDGGFNNKALSRDVVMHGADYVSYAYARANKRIGRSWGCPAVARNMAAPIIDKIKNGSVLFIHHPSKQYLRRSYWLNNRIARLPRNANKVIAVQQSKDKQNEAANPKVKEAKDFIKEEVAPEPKAKPLTTITEYKDPEELEKLKNQDNTTLKSIVIPADAVTPAMRAKALKKKKIVREVNKIEIIGGKTKEAVTK